MSKKKEKEKNENWMSWKPERETQFKKSEWVENLKEQLNPRKNENRIWVEKFERAIQSEKEWSTWYELKIRSGGSKRNDPGWKLKREIRKEKIGKWVREGSF